MSYWRNWVFLSGVGIVLCHLNHSGIWSYSFSHLLDLFLSNPATYWVLMSLYLPLRILTWTFLESEWRNQCRFRWHLIAWRLSIVGLLDESGSFVNRFASISCNVLDCWSRQILLLLPLKKHQLLLLVICKNRRFFLVGRICSLSQQLLRSLMLEFLRGTLRWLSVLTKLSVFRHLQLLPIRDPVISNDLKWLWLLELTAWLSVITQTLRHRLYLTLFDHKRLTFRGFVADGNFWAWFVIFDLDFLFLFHLV